MAIKAQQLLVLLAIFAGANCHDLLNAATPDFNVETLARGLDTPWAMDFAPDGRIFVTERLGRIAPSNTANFSLNPG